MWIVSSLLVCLLTYNVHSFGPIPGEPCNLDRCQLPNCRCLTYAVPGDLSKEETPQFVILTMQGTADAYNTEMYKGVVDGLKNPNGCPVSGTWFVNDHLTDYRTVNNIYNNYNMEIGFMPMVEESDTFWEEAVYGDWMGGIESARSAIAFLGNVPRSEIRGLRGHNEMLGGNHQFQAYFDYTSPSDELVYDATWLFPVVKNQYWPFTLDYFNPLECMKGSCPYNSFPGIWEVPTSPYLAWNGTTCINLLQCEELRDDESFPEFFKRNFLRHYQGSKAPFTIRLDYDFLNPIYPQHVTEIRETLSELLKYPDVYIVSVKEALEWIRHPTPISNLADFPYWNCGNTELPTACENPSCCKFDTGTTCFSEECDLNSVMPKYDVPHEYCVRCTKMLPIWGNPYGMRNNVGECLD